MTKTNDPFNFQNYKIGAYEVMDQQNETTNELTDFQKDMIHRFNIHASNTQDVSYAHATIRNQCLKLSSYIGRYVPDCEEKKEAIKRLEEVMFWSNAGIARNQKE